jgi:hypothetical protein
MQGSMLTESQLYNVLSCFHADQEEGRFIVRGHITSFLGMGQEFVIDESAEYRCSESGTERWFNLLAAVKVTSYHMPIQVF